MKIHEGNRTIVKSFDTNFDSNGCFKNISKNYVSFKPFKTINDLLFIKSPQFSKTIKIFYMFHVCYDSFSTV